MKAVVWTDAFQTFIMLGALIWIVVKGKGAFLLLFYNILQHKIYKFEGVMDSGGLGQVWADNWETGRINLFEYDKITIINKLYTNSICFFLSCTVLIQVRIHE